MLNLVLALFAGIAVGFFMPSGFMSRAKSVVFTISLLGLLFFMGVNLGRDPLLLTKLADFGLISAFMSLTVVVFSVLAVFTLLRLFGAKES